MAIQQTAIDLRNPRFRPAFGGADPADVDGLLDLAAESYEAAYTELDQLRARHAEVSRQLKAMYEGERAVSRVVIEAEEAAGEIRKAAETEIRRILTDAEMRSLAITEPVEAAREALALEIEAVQDRRTRAARALEHAIGELEGRAVDPVTGRPADSASDTPQASAVALLPDAPSAPSEEAPAIAQSDGEAVDRVQEGPTAALTGVQDAGQEEGFGPAPLGDSGLPEAGVTDGAGSSTHVISAVERPMREEVVQREEIAARAEEPSDRHPNDVAGLPEAAADNRTPEEKLRELIAARGARAGDEGEPGSAARDSEVPWSGLGEDAGEGNGSGLVRRPWVLATAAAAVLAIGAAIGLPRLTGLLDATSTGTTMVAGERIDVPVLAASAVPSAAPDRRDARPAVSTAPSERQHPLSLRLTASRECWVRVTVDGQPEERVLAAGQAIMRGADREIAIRVGDAGALAVELNGESLPPLGRDGQVVNRVFRPSVR